MSAEDNHRELVELKGISGIPFGDDTEVCYHNPGGGRLGAYQSWVLRGNGLKDATFGVVGLKGWLEADPELDVEGDHEKGADRDGLQANTSVDARMGIQPQKIRGFSFEL